MVRLLATRNRWVTQSSAKGTGKRTFRRLTQRTGSPAVLQLSKVLGETLCRRANSRFDNERAEGIGPEVDEVVINTLSSALISALY